MDMTQRIASPTAGPIVYMRRFDYIMHLGWWGGVQYVVL